MAFIQENIYINESDFETLTLEKRKIFINQTINVFDFGKLYIDQSGNVYANPLMKALGTIDDNIKALIYKELENGKSWRRIRNSFPCNNCIYQWLCPSPSDLELLIGKNNLCNVC